ncbi:MAG: DUF4350 domain-containing protein [Flavobacterium sp.]|nr:MAG: DUF4350 domain-containing protein [Flavobacterium sp.]
MNKKLIVFGGIFAMLFVLLMYLDSQKPKPISWSPSYSTYDKNPLGLFVLDKEMPALFKGQAIKKFGTTPYEYYQDLYNYDTEEYTANGTFLKIENEILMDRESVNELIYYAEHGNTVFLSSKQFPDKLLDTLKIKISTGGFHKDSVAFSLNKIAPKNYFFNEGLGFSYFKSIDTLRTEVLGRQVQDTADHANFIKVPFGKGSFLLHTQPAVFSNFHLLKGNHYEYTEALASYIPQGNIYWHSAQFGGGEGVSGSPLRYIYSQPAMRWAWTLSLLGLLIFVLFKAKRKQRIIPEIVPLKNTTVDFARTIGNLYFMEGNHQTIIDKKIIYFLEKIRNEYLIDTHILNDEFVGRLHLKTGNAPEDIKITVDLITRHRNRHESSEADVIEINKAIEKIRL